MPEDIHVIVYGLGPIGTAVARHIRERQGLRLVGGVEVDISKVGKDMGAVIGLDHQLGFPVVSSLTEALHQTHADIVVHTTHSFFDLFQNQILEILNAGLHVVSTAEELSFPWLANAEDAANVDRTAKEAGKTVLSTGVNPGFLMDTLPLVLTSICQRVEYIEVNRHMNASLRRGPFQSKIGSGMTVGVFNARMAGGRMGHVGLSQSMAMIFDTLGKRLCDYKSIVEPVLAEKQVMTRFYKLEPGQVRGLKQIARGYTDTGEFCKLTFIAALDEPVNQDTIKIKGVPELKVTLKGTNGDLATVAIVVNAIPSVIKAPPGLVTMRDLPIVTHW